MGLWLPSTTIEQMVAPQESKHASTITPVEVWARIANFWHLTMDEIFDLSYEEIELYYYAATKVLAMDAVNNACLIATAFHNPKELENIRSSI